MAQGEWQRTARIGTWELGIALDAINWTFGIYYENAVRELHLLFGPINVWFCSNIDNGHYWPSGSLFVRRWRKREVRLDWSTHQFLLGYSRSRRQDHSIYFGPIDLQIEYVERDHNVSGGLITDADIA